MSAKVGEEQSQVAANNTIENDFKMTHRGNETSEAQPKFKRKYTFAPINREKKSLVTKENAQGIQPSVLRSISVSQIRNTSSKKENAATEKREALDTTNIPKLRREHSSSSKTKGNVSIDKSVGSVRGREPHEEVIWQYDPIVEDLSTKTPSSPVHAYNPIEGSPNPSSTPLIPQNLKSVLNFGHSSDKESSSTNPKSAPSNDAHVSKKVKIGTKMSRKMRKEFFRDIDDILNDIESDLSVKHAINVVNELPSSPERLDIPAVTEEGRLEEVRNTINPSEVDRLLDPAHIKDNDFGDSSTMDGDDEALIELLTQYKNIRRASQSEKRRTQSHSSKSEDGSETLDDSLLDYLENSAKSHPKTDATSAGSRSNIEVNMENTTLNQPSEKSKVRLSEHRKLDEYAELAKGPVRRPGVARMVVVTVNELTLPRIGRQKIVTCINSEGTKVSVIIRHPWVYLDIEEGDVLHIVEGRFAVNKRLLSDDRDPKTGVVNDNLLIVNPDLLLSATSVSNAVTCLRSGVIDSMFQDIRGEPSIVMTVGNIVHELLQSALKFKLSHSKISIEFLQKKLDSLLNVYSFEILICDEDVEALRQQITTDHLVNILDFVNKFVQSDNYGRYVSISGTRRTQPISIPNVIDIEENIWSHTYGLKGFLDATVEVNVENKKTIAPLEAKTGRTKSISHEAQGLIYTLLLSDRYEMPVDFFLLYYTREKTMTKFPRLLQSVKHILMTRNQLAYSLKTRLRVITSTERMDLKLPPLLSGSFCDRCYNRIPCMVLHTLVEDGVASDYGIGETEFQSITGHLSGNREAYKEFFLKYNDLITKEESSVCNINQELFLLDSRTRESISGHCLSNLVIRSAKESEVEEESYIFVFTRKDNEEDLQTSMLQSQINVGDMVIISDEMGQFSISEGYVKEINKDSVTVVTKRKYLNNKIRRNDAKTMEVRSVIHSTIERGSSLDMQNVVTYRIDKNEIFQNIAISRFNLLNLFMPPVRGGEMVLNESTGKVRRQRYSDGGDERMRTLLLDGREPKFAAKDEEPIVSYKLPAGLNFNEDQLNAIDKCLRAKDCALILGMPGTGKTTVIAEIIKLLTLKDKKVLLAAYTHSAVDNILLKLLDSDVKIVRLGAKKNIHRQTQRYMPDYGSVKSYNEFCNFINNASVVATTCLGLRDVIFSLMERDFDYVILDEASQISIPVALGPLRFGKKFIMVGDHYQLPPLIKNDAARVGGLDVSLFELLCNKYPQSVVELTYQYRMCGDIVKLSNFLIYENKLKSGTSAVDCQSLQIPHPENLSDMLINRSKESQGWLNELLKPDRKVIWVDYDSVDDARMLETAEGDRILNEGECELVKLCVVALVHCGVSPQQIGVMTLYRAQLRLLRKQFSKAPLRDVETLTADQFQGRDKDCIIISMVRSNKQNNAGSLLREVRRLNVAMTRAKSKLIIIGSRKTVGSIREINPFLQMLESNNWVYQLPVKPLEVYHLPPLNTPSSSQASQRSRLFGAKNFTASSQLLRDKPITRQVLGTYEKRI